MVMMIKKLCRSLINISIVQIKINQIMKILKHIHHKIKLRIAALNKKLGLQIS